MERAEGALLGALVGDAAGATLEFRKGRPTGEDVAEALDMVGAGWWRLAPGQITDDGELTLSCARTLAERSDLDEDAHARGYLDWFQSQPFDMGETTATALQAGIDPEFEAARGEHGLATVMQAVAEVKNSGSKANGSLMRAVPLGLWGHRLPTDELAALARFDSRLTHSHPTCQDAVATYVIALASLLRDGHRQAAFDRAQQWARGNAVEEVRGWLEDAVGDDPLPCNPHVGFVRWGFTLAFRHLVRESDFVEALRTTLARGGDTDTNACIVGGLLGAAVGLKGIPEKMYRAMLQVDTARGRPRPAHFVPHDALALAQRLMAAAPQHITQPRPIPPALVMGR